MYAPEIRSGEGVDRVGSESDVPLAVATPCAIPFCATTIPPSAVACTGRPTEVTPCAALHAPEGVIDKEKYTTEPTRTKAPSAAAVPIPPMIAGFHDLIVWARLTQSATARNHRCHVGDGSLSVIAVVFGAASSIEHPYAPASAAQSERDRIRHFDTVNAVARLPKHREPRADVVIAEPPNRDVLHSGELAPAIV